MSRKIRVGITHGDINGVGYEIILKVLEDERILELCTPVVYGSAKLAANYRKSLGLGNIPFNQIETADEAKEGTNNIVNVVPEEMRAEPGVSSRGGRKGRAGGPRARRRRHQERRHRRAGHRANQQGKHTERGISFSRPH